MTNFQDCFAYNEDGNEKTKCVALTECLCQTIGKCNFYKKPENCDADTLKIIKKAKKEMNKEDYEE